MIDIASILFSVAGKRALEELLQLFKGNKKELQKSYEGAFQKTIDWYEQKYQNKYGEKNNRFFDFEIANQEFAKLLFLHREPNIAVISEIEFKKRKTTPHNVAKEFIGQLWNELSQVREFEAILVERKNLMC